MAFRGAGLCCFVNTTKGLVCEPRIFLYTTKNVKCSPLYCSNQDILGFGLGRAAFLGRNSLNLREGFSPPSRPETPRSPLCSPCQVSGDDAERTVRNESIFYDEQTLEQELQMAIEEENYTQAAKIRDRLLALHEDSKALVLSANSRFYESFRQGDLAGMQGLWVKSENACCVHPGAKGINGYELVMESWEIVWMSYDFPLEIEVRDIEVHVRGSVGYVTCMEFVKTKGSSWGAQFATNVFERIDGEWFICVHHASPVDV